MTDAPIRLFNREGREIYDSRSDVRSPGQVLNEARQARLDDPHVTRSLHAGYRQQLDWHAHLPEALSHSTNVAPQTAQRLLVERSEPPCAPYRTFLTPTPRTSALTCQPACSMAA